MVTMDQALLPDDRVVMSVLAHEIVELTSFASFTASSHKPFAMPTLLRKMKKRWELVGWIDSAAE